FRGTGPGTSRRVRKHTSRRWPRGWFLGIECLTARPPLLSGGRSASDSRGFASHMSPTESTSPWVEFRRRRRLWLRFTSTLPIFLVYSLAVAALRLDPHGTLVLVFMAPVIVALPVWLVAYVVLRVRVTTWRCPNCGGRFCHAWWINWPWASRCVHCRFP